MFLKSVLPDEEIDLFLASRFQGKMAKSKEAIMRKRLLKISVLTILALGGLGVVTSAQGRDFLPGPFGGELRGMTRLTGKLVCTDCSLAQLREDLAGQMPDQLYEFQNREQKVVFRVSAVGDLAHTGNQDASQAGHWQAIAGLSKRVVVRADESLWQTLTAQDNRQKQVELNCWLRSTGTLDIAEMTFLE